MVPLSQIWAMAENCLQAKFKSVINVFPYNIDNIINILKSCQYII